MKAQQIINTHSQVSGQVNAAHQLVNIVQQLRNWWLARRRWTVAIASTDRLYDVAHRWFAGISGDNPPKALTARLQYGGSSESTFDSPSTSSRESLGRVELYYDVSESRTVEIDGHPVMVTMHKPASPNAPTNDDAGVMKSLLEPDVLYFHARSREGQKVVIKMLGRLVSEQHQRKPALHLLNNWGSWSRRDDLPARSLDSVVLAEGQMDRLRKDIERFLAAEAAYVRRGQPWHRGYLLHGPPGTGKTSIVRALSAHFGLDLWYAPLGDLTKDASLLSLINDVGARSILLLEDVDIFHAARERDDGQAGATMAGLLNALDGVATPHGLITVMTTNALDVIDEALLRPGRVDMREEIGLPTSEQLVRLWSAFYSRPIEDVDRMVRFAGSTADAMEIFKRHPENPQAAMRVLLGEPLRAVGAGGFIRPPATTWEDRT